MTIDLTRREGLSLALASLVAACATSHGADMATTPQHAGGVGDFDFLVGKWNVAHSRLKGRLNGSTEWEEFPGTSELWLTMGGLGTVDDNVLHIPSGTYNATGIRAFNAATGKWAIWWLDLRTPDAIEPPVYGSFANGMGEFVGDDTLRGQPIKVRFRWLDIASGAPRWEQAFSPDDGKTWEVNWRMQFTRA